MEAGYLLDILQVMKTRKVYPGEVHHVCQQTVNKVLVFYSVSDYLVFFTVFCTIARRFGVQVLALCPMVDHIHCVLLVQDEKSLSRFVHEYTRLYAHLWNESRGRKGPLFKHRFMSAVKMGNKQIRTTLCYNYNNPVERKMVQRAEAYRWNFLSYARNDAPFSAPLIEQEASWVLRGILREARSLRQQEKYLSYALLKRWEKKLDAIEYQQLVDYIIGTWNVIDYGTAMAYYGNYDAMLRAFHDNTGSEYDIKEDRDNYSDAVYADCNRILKKEVGLSDPCAIFGLPVEQKTALFRLLGIRTTATPRQLCKYLHYNAV